MAKPLVANVPPNGGTLNLFVPLKNGGLEAEIQTVTIGGGGITNVLVDTTENWNSDPSRIGDKNVVYMYTDHQYNEQGQAIPAFKIGDGKAYLIDLPFDDELVTAHIQNTTIHVTEEEKAFWNSKVTAFLDANDLETLVLSSNTYITSDGSIAPFGWSEG